ncbi:tubulin-specific chaperone A-like [Oppia nitens]|uniref:tubulin-specific chaperone A-like n=1 Tax=Oppia nitens TaxID=1686743 RepID=UPI0023DBD8F3|nr:tubulin-specific chaperone A-like [Oppia nitens]
MTDPRLNQMRIKTGILKRVTKEKTVYEKEVDNERKRLETMKSQNKDDYEIRKQEEVINESLMMLPDTMTRIQQAFNDLNNIIQETQTELSETTEFQTAKTLVQEVQQLFQ